MGILVTLVGVADDDVEDFYYFTDCEFGAGEGHFLAFISDDKFDEMLWWEELVLFNAFKNPF